MNAERDIVLFSHGLTGHRANWLRIFAMEAKRQNRKIHLVMESSVIGEKFLDDIQTEIKEILCFHISQDGSKGVVNEVLRIRSNFPHILIATAEGEEWFHLILRLRRRVRVLFMRPYVQEYSTKGFKNYLFKFLIIKILTFFKNSQVGLLAIPKDRPSIFRRLWIDELSSKRSELIERDVFLHEKLKLEVGIPRNSEFILVPGFITRRKNPELIIEAFEIFLKKYDKPGCVLLFSGKVEDYYRNYFADYVCERIFYLDRYLTESEYSSLIHHAHLVILAYNNRASSGVIVDCIELAKKVIFVGDRRWNNLYYIAPDFLIKGSKQPHILADCILESFADSKEDRPHINWRENRDDVLHFIFNESI